MVQPNGTLVLYAHDPRNRTWQPRLVEGVEGVHEVAATPTEACVRSVQGGIVSCWGAPNYNLDPETAECTWHDGRPHVLLDGAVSLLTVGESFCAMREDGQLYCWGAILRRSFPFLGSRHVPFGIESSCTPLPVVLPTQGPCPIASRTGPLCAADARGTVACWSLGQRGWPESGALARLGGLSEAERYHGLWSLGDQVCADAVWHGAKAFRCCPVLGGRCRQWPLVEDVTDVTWSPGEALALTSRGVIHLGWFSEHRSSDPQCERPPMDGCVQATQSCRMMRSGEVSCRHRDNGC